MTGRSDCRSRRGHGDAISYTHYGCRCPDAREAATAYRRNLRTGGSEEVDPVVVDQCIAGRLRYVDLSRVERTAVVARLTAAGRSVAFIADLCGTYERDVQRRRARARARGMLEVAA